MNLRFLKLFVLLFISINTFAQTSDLGFSFQGYAVDMNGKAIVLQNITVEFNIGGINGFTETHNNIATDAYGVFNAIVGSINKSAFKEVNFSDHSAGQIHKLKVTVTPNGGAPVVVFDAPLQSVPYARSAANGVPVGTIVAYGGDINKIPFGWLLCDGTSVNKVDYPQLFEMMGYVWGGAGNSFTIPDLRGRFLRGVGGVDAVNPDRANRKDISGSVIGDKVGSYEESALKTHNHGGVTTADGDHNHTSPDYCNYCGTVESSATFASGSGHPGLSNTNRGTSYSGNHSHTISSDGTSAESKPINAAVYYIIKY